MTLVADGGLGQGLPLRTQGTINVVVANAKGAVVVTDSRLSNEGSPAGQAPKLFQLDSVTVCAIAGYYSDFGPSIPGTKSYPAATTIPFLISQYRQQRTEGLGLEQKLDLMVQIFEFNLAFVNAARRSLAGPAGSPSEITIVGFDRGRISIVGAKLIPRTDAGVVRYILTERKRIDVASELVYRVAGITDVADSVLGHRVGLESSDDPILRFLGDALARDRGSSLSLLDLENIAKRLARITAARHPREVGPPLQVAVLSDEVVKSFDSLPNDDKLFQGMRVRQTAFGILCKAGAGSEGVGGIRAPAIVLIENGNIENCRQNLDNTIIIGTRFVNCHLVYSGEPRTYFGSDNQLIGSDLTLENGADLESIFVKYMKEAYPNLVIRRGEERPKVTPD